MIEPKLPIISSGNDENLYASFLEAYEAEEMLSPVVFESEEILLRFCPDANRPQSDTAKIRLAKLVDDSSSCPELRKVAEAARKAASTHPHKPHGFVDHILGMSASLVGISLLASLVVGVLGLCAIVIGVLVPFELI